MFPGGKPTTPNLGYQQGKGKESGEEGKRGKGGPITTTNS